MKQIQFRIIQAGTVAYQEMIGLRMKVLLGPIGIPPSYINPQKEAEDLLIGGYNNSSLIGCCILTRIDAGTVQLRQMAVDSDHQQKGVGTSLLTFAEAAAAERGYRTVVMHARDTVLAFYRKCGYSINSEQFFEVGIPHHKMAKALSTNNRLQ